MQSYNIKEQKQDTYNFIILTNFYLLLTATHSFKSSPSGSITANLKLPDPSVAAACFIKSY